LLRLVYARAFLAVLATPLPRPWKVSFCYGLGVREQEGSDRVGSLSLLVFVSDVSAWLS